MNNGCTIVRVFKRHYESYSEYLLPAEDASFTAHALAYIEPGCEFGVINSDELLRSYKVNVGNLTNV